MLAELGGSQVEVQRCSLQVEVQRCSLNSAGPRLRSSGAHCAQTLAVEVQQCPRCLLFFVLFIVFVLFFACFLGLFLLGGCFFWFAFLFVRFSFKVSKK